MLRITPQRVAVVYAALRAFPPFCRLKCPAPEAVDFRVSKAVAHDASYTRYLYTDHHIIEVSLRRNGHFSTLAMSVAHEMIHLHQARAKTETSGAEHNAEFKRIAHRACRHFGWDEKQFT